MIGATHSEDESVIPLVVVGSTPEPCWIASNSPDIFFTI